MAAKNKSKPRKRNNQSNTSLAKRQRAITKALSNKGQNQPKTDLTFLQKVWNYKNWIPIPVVVALVVAWFSYYPKNIIVTEKEIGSLYPTSNAIILTNKNRYSVNDIIVTVKGTGDIKIHGNTFFDYVLKSDKYVFQINAGDSKTVFPTLIEGGKPTELNNARVKVFLSYKTPFYYPDIKRQTKSFKLILNSSRDVIYFPD